MRDRLPRLKAFYEQHADLRDRFEIIALHESRTLKTFAELDVKNAKTEGEIWKGPLPFPALMDKEGRTVRRYGVSMYPTVVLIDPQGRLVKGGSLALLAEKLGNPGQAPKK